MVTVKADDKQRVRIPDIKPGQVFAILHNADGSLTLAPLKPDTKRPFPKGSLAKYFTPERDNQELAILKSCVPEPDSGE